MEAAPELMVPFAAWYLSAALLVVPILASSPFGQFAILAGVAAASTFGG